MKMWAPYNIQLTLICSTLKKEGMLKWMWKVLFPLRKISLLFLLKRNMFYNLVKTTFGFKQENRTCFSLATCQCNGMKTFLKKHFFHNFRIMVKRMFLKYLVKIQKSPSEINSSHLCPLINKSGKTSSEHEKTVNSTDKS